MTQRYVSPDLLFLTNWGSAEQAYLKVALSALRASGYTRYVEPSAGPFNMVLVARTAGFQPEMIEASDCSFYSAVVGYLLADKDLATLDARLDGIPIELSGPPLEQAGILLWSELIARMTGKPSHLFWDDLIDDLEVRRSAHIEALCSNLRRLEGELTGIHFEPLDIWSQVEQAEGDPKAVINVYPRPQYRSFAETRGRLTWAGATQGKWTPEDSARLVNRQTAALIICQEVAPPRGAAHPRPVYARHAGPGKVVYMSANRPEELLKAAGLRVQRRDRPDLERLAVTILPASYPFTPLSRVQIEPLPHRVAAYYKELWLHRITPSPADYNMAVFVDGYLAGVAGYSADTMRGYGDTWLDALRMLYGVGAPSDVRLTRLIVELVLQRQVVEAIVNPQYAAAAERIVTSEFKKHPESMGLRGLMKMHSRTPDPRYHGFRLVYAAPLGDKSPQQVMESWLRKELRYRQQGGTA